MIIEKWNEVKTELQKIIKESNFEKGLTKEELNYSNFRENIPIDLLEILHNANGQIEKSKPIFIDFKNSSNGIIVSKYYFLSLAKIIELHGFIQDYSKKQIDKNLIPYAVYEKNIGDKGTKCFTIHKIDKTVHKTIFYEYDRFTTVYEFRSEKIAENLEEFLENQLKWRSLKLE
jgi:hypothetical protein